MSRLVLETVRHMITSAELWVRNCYKERHLRDYGPMVNDVALKSSSICRDSVMKGPEFEAGILSELFSAGPYLDENSRNRFCSDVKEPTFTISFVLMPIRSSEGRCATGETIISPLPSKPINPRSNK